MKRTVLLLVTLIIAGCSCSVGTDYQLSDDFLTDFAAENNRMEGDLTLDVYHGNLSTMTYDFYLSYIAENEAPSAAGFSFIVKAATRQYFKATRTNFIVVLYYPRERKILVDNSDTPFLDFVKVLGDNESIGDLSQYADIP